jgi:hypothetical protein
MQNNPKIILTIVICAIMATTSCLRKSVKYLSRPIPPNTGVAVIINAPQNIKNVVMAQFLARGFSVKGVNAADFYSLNDIFDIRDFKKVSYVGQDNNFLSLEKTYNNLYKMHYYNFEVNKAEVLADMRNKWNVQYLILLDLQPFPQTSWGRAIDLKTNDIIWIENHPTTGADTIEKIVDRFIDSMVGR